MKKRIRIYNSGGALPMCAHACDHLLKHIFDQSATESLKNSGRDYGQKSNKSKPSYTNEISDLESQYDISFIDAHEIRSQTSNWQNETALIVFSGGAVTGFKQALGAHTGADGVQAIKDYVANGGMYLGLCAGAYFGAEDIDFKGYDWETKQPYTRGGKGLGFYNGLAIGSLKGVAPLYDGTSATCRIVDVTLAPIKPSSVLKHRTSHPNFADQSHLEFENSPAAFDRHAKHAKNTTPHIPAPLFGAYDLANMTKVRKLPAAYTKNMPTSPIFYGGGPAFTPFSHPDSKHTDHSGHPTKSQVVSHYIADNGKTYPAAVFCEVGDKGGSALLLSWHADLSADFLSKWMCDGNDDDGENRLSLAQELTLRNKKLNAPQKWVGNILRHYMKP